MRLSKLIAFSFSRKSNISEPSYHQLEESKWKHFTKYSKRYESDQKFQHQDKLYEQFLYGHSCHIAAVTPNNFHSAKFAKSVMKYTNPNLLILGGLNDNFCRVWETELGLRQRYQHPLYKTDRMQCKDRLNKLIQARLEKDPDFLWDDKKKEIFTINHKEKRICPSDYLTVAHMASIQDHTKVAFGRPSDAIVFEDIILRFSVQQLKKITERAINRALQNQKNEKSWRLSYTRQVIQNYVMSEQPSIYSKQLTYQAALLKRYTKIQSNILLLTSGYFIQRIAEQVHHLNLTPQQVFRNGLDDRNSQMYSLYEQAIRAGPQQILQKFALICLLKQNWIQNQFAGGNNVFNYTIFAKLFENMTIDELMGRYSKARQAVEGKWLELIRYRVNNVHVVPGAHIRLELKEQLDLLQERISLNFPYTYEEKNYLSDYENRVKLHELENKMKAILNEQGDKHQIDLFQKFMKGQRSREGIILYSKLLGKANVESYERLKLPVFHYQAFRGIYKEYLRDFLLKGTEVKQIQEKIKNRMTKIQQLMENHMKKLDNPQELNKYLTGKKGKTMQVNFDPEDGPKFSQEDIQFFQNAFGEMTPEDEKQMQSQYDDNDRNGFK